MCEDARFDDGRPDPDRERNMTGETLHVHGAACGHVGLDILVDGGPLCVAPVWNFEAREKVTGLFFVYFKKHGIPIGPYYAGIGLASHGMRKLLREFPPGGFWEQELEWYPRQAGFRAWVDQNLGKSGDLVGGVWAPEEEKT
jgi:hypothetical protein